MAELLYFTYDKPISQPHGILAHNPEFRPSVLQLQFRPVLKRALGEMAKIPNLDCIVVNEELAIGPYWADFHIRVWEKWPPQIDSENFKVGIGTDLIVEIDGHDYHSSQKQLKHDHDRDEWIFKNSGYSIRRFTGSEINGGPRRCANHIVDLLIYLLEDCNWTRFQYRVDAGLADIEALKSIARGMSPLGETNVN